jgi:hypothetical protein
MLGVEMSLIKKSVFRGLSAGSSSCSCIGLYQVPLSRISVKGKLHPGAEGKISRDGTDRGARYPAADDL